MTDVLIRSVVSMYQETKTRVRMDSELSEESDGNARMHQGSVLSPFLQLW